MTGLHIARRGDVSVPTILLGPIAYVTSLTDNANLGTALSTDLTAQNVGDLAVCLAYCGGSTAPTVPAGWTSRQTGTTAQSWVLATRVKQAGDGAFSWAMPATVSSGLICDVWRKAAWGQVAAATADTTSGTVVTFNALTLASTASTSSLMAAMGAGTTGVVTPPTGYTASAQVTTNEGVITERNLTPAAGVVTPGNISFVTAKSNRVGIHIELIPG